MDHQRPKPSTNGPEVPSKEQLATQLKEMEKMKEENAARQKRRRWAGTSIGHSGGWGKARAQQIKHRHYTHKARSAKRSRRRLKKRSQRGNRT